MQICWYEQWEKHSHSFCSSKSALILFTPSENQLFEGKTSLAIKEKPKKSNSPLEKNANISANTQSGLCYLNSIDQVFGENCFFEKGKPGVDK